MAGIEHPRVKQWLEIREPIERQLAPLGNAAIEALDLKPGEHVLDLGCGIGGTPVALAAAVGPLGRIAALDLLPAAIGVLARDADLPTNVSLLVGDAQHYPFVRATFDAVFSRFGVMFFDDPVAGFSNVARAVRPGGRIGFVCWRGLDENELDHMPLRAASPYLPPELVCATVEAPWFSFCDSEVIRAALSAAGWANIAITPRDMSVGSGDLQSTVEICARVGALGAILREHPQFAARAVPALTGALRPVDGSDGPYLRAAIWLVTAIRPE